MSVCAAHLVEEDGPVILWVARVGRVDVLAAADTLERELLEGLPRRLGASDAEAGVHLDGAEVEAAIHTTAS